MNIAQGYRRFFGTLQHDCEQVLQPFCTSRDTTGQRHLSSKCKNALDLLKSQYSMQKVMTMEEVEAQLKRKSQQQQQQGMSMSSADSGMLGSLGQHGPSGHPGPTAQLPTPGAFPPQPPLHGPPPGFGHLPGPPQRPPQYNGQHQGIHQPVAREVFNMRKETCLQL